MPGSRPEKVGEVIRQEISRIIHDELKDPRIGFVTVTRVEMTKDCRYARVYFSILGNEQDCQKGVEGLLSARGYIRKLVGQTLNLRYTPEISFKLDKSIGYSIHIQEILDKLKQEQTD